MGKVIIARRGAWKGRAFRLKKRDGRFAIGESGRDRRSRQAITAGPSTVVEGYSELHLHPDGRVIPHHPGFAQ